MNNGAFGENFPYSNFHDLNMDWIIKIVKDFLDQYTHIQELIEQGKTDIINLTEDGLTQLQDKANNLEELLQEWYDTHSAELADQLAQAVADIASALSQALNNFAVGADRKAQEAIATIPSDYSAFYTAFHDIEYALQHYIAKENLFDVSTYTPDTSINVSTGVTYSASGYWTSYFIPVYEGFSVIGYGTEPYETINFFAMYDANKTFISCDQNFKGRRKIPANVKFIRICNSESRRPHSTYKLYYVNEQIYTELVTKLSTDDTIFVPSEVFSNYAINVTTGNIYVAQGYYTTQFREVFPGMTFDGFLDGIPTIPNFLALYDENYALIECRTMPDTPLYTTENIKYIRICNGMVAKPANRYCYKCTNITDYYASASAFINGSRWLGSKLIKNDGTIMSTTELYSVSDFIPVADITGYTVRNAVSYPTAQANSIAFYDKGRNVIGTAYAPGASTLHPETFKIDNTLLANYPGAVYCRIGKYALFDTRIINDTDNFIINNPYPSYKLNFYHNILFCGDSVTKGFVCEGTQANPEIIYRTMPDYSYPENFGRTYPKANIAISASEGASPLIYYNNIYPTTDYTPYDLIFVELGLNGGLDIADINTANTNTWAFKKIIEGIRNQNSNATIVLVRSQHFLANASQDNVFKTVAQTYSTIYVDLHDTKFLDLDNTRYHGYYNNNGTPAIDYAHFTRFGYCAKAYVVISLLTSQMV